MNIRLIYLLLLIAVIGIGFGSYYLFAKPNTMPTNPNEPFTIVAFGDSLTAGYGVSDNDSYPSVLQSRLQADNPYITVLNMGVSGETSTGGLKRVQSAIDRKPNLVLLELGANDMFRKIDPATVRANLEAIIIAFKNANIPVVILGMEATPTYGSAYKKEFDAIYRDLADQYDLPIVPFFLEGVALNSSLNISDYIHPNAAGYLKIVDKNVLPVVEKIVQ